MTTKIEQIIENIIDDMWERPFAREWDREAKNMRKILKKHLQSLQPTEREVEWDYKRFGRMVRHILSIPMWKIYWYAMPDYILKIEKLPYDKWKPPKVFVDEFIDQ